MHIEQRAVGVENERFRFHRGALWTIAANRVPGNHGGGNVKMLETARSRMSYTRA